MRIGIFGAVLVLLCACGGTSSDGNGGEQATSSAGGGGGTGNTTSATTTGSVTTASGSGGAGGAATTAGTGGSGAVWGPDQCPATPPGVAVGFDIGDQLGDIVVKDCDGNDVSLTTFCGASALFVFGAFGWCPLCQSVSAQQEALTDELAGQNVASLNVIVENAQGDPPNAEYCKIWRDAYGHEDVVTLYDPTGAILALWDGGGSSSYSAFMDSDRVIVSKLEHTSDLEAIKAGIEGALAH